MKCIKYIVLSNLLINVILIPHVFAQNADVTCVYRETVRKDVTQPAFTQAIPHKNATDIDCCPKHNYACQRRLKNSAQAYCNRPDRVPAGYTLSSVKVTCENSSAREKTGIEYTVE